MTNNKSIKLNAAKILSIKKKIDFEISDGSHIIRDENVMSKKAIAAKQGSGKDLKALYNHIQQLREKRIMLKGMIQYLNMGTTTFNYEEFKKTNYFAIFSACEAKEDIALLKMIKTLNPKTKAQKGKKALASSETFSKEKIAQLIHDQQLNANKYDAMLEKFNTDTSIDITNNSDTFEEYLII
jgi:hypothetical protein